MARQPTKALSEEQSTIGQNPRPCVLGGVHSGAKRCSPSGATDRCLGVLNHLPPLVRVSLFHDPAGRVWVQRTVVDSIT